MVRESKAYKIFLYVKLVRAAVVTMFRKAVFMGRPKCASNGATCVLLCLIPRSVVIIAERDSLSWKSFPKEIFIHPNFSLSVRINLSTSPVGLWSSTGEYITLMLLRSQKVMNGWLVKQVPWSQRIDRGIPCICVYFSMNFITFCVGWVY